MNEKQKTNTTALPLDDRPEVHQAGEGSSRPISLQQDKDIREGHLPEDRFDDERMKDLPRAAGVDEPLPSDTPEIKIPGKPISDMNPEQDEP